MTPTQEKIARAANRVESRLRYISPTAPIAVDVRALLDAIADGLKRAQENQALSEGAK